MSDYDVVIVGSGLAGLTASLFAARHGLSTLVLENNIPGGHLISIEKIEDFPGFPDGIAGYDLCPTVQRQAADQGAEFRRAEVLSLEAQDRLWSVVTDEERHGARAVIVATGSRLKNLGVPGEEKLMGRGVSHCASCDGPLYNGETVGVVGGGDSALQEALALANFAERVLLFCVATGTDWRKVIAPGTAQHMLICDLVERDGADLTLTDQGRAVLETLMMRVATKGA